MLHSAVLLDAAMPPDEARRRLAEHGYLWWSDRSTAWSRAWQAARAAEMGGDAAGEGGTAKDAAAWTTVAELERHGRPTYTGLVAIRRQQGVTVFWYARAVDDVLRAIDERGDATPTLGDALELHEYTSDPVVQAADLDPRADGPPGVVLRGQQFVGVTGPPIAMAGPPPTAATPDAATDEASFGDDWPRPPGGTRGGMGSGASGGSGGSRGIGDGSRGPSRDIAPPPPPPPPPPPSSLTPPQPSQPHSSFSAFPSLEAPQVAVVGQGFDLVVGLAKERVAGVASAGAMTFTPAPGAVLIPVEVQVIADGFEAPNGCRHMLDVSVNAPTEARVRVPLVPRPQAEPVRLTAVHVRYSVGGVACGTASRHVVVMADAAMAPPPPDERGTAWADAEPAPAPMRVAASQAEPPDLEVDLVKADNNPATGAYRCALRTPHDVPLPDETLPVDLGADAATFAKQLIDNVRAYSAHAIVDNVLRARGRKVADRLPRAFWDVLRAVAARVEAQSPGRPVALQFNSAEPWVPWELALVEPPLDPARPPFLGAQVAMGRWVVGESDVPAPPRTTVPVRAMAVMAGMYNAASGLTALPEAAAEAKALARTYAAVPAVPMACSLDGFKRLLDATVEHDFETLGGVQAVHIAAHGEVDPTRPGSAALYLSDGMPLDPILFVESALGRQHAPFMFLNACMVGTGGESLGGTGGFPGNCLTGGFTGLVAPLWAVNDQVARDVAIDFYKEAFAEQGARPVAEVLRDLRARYAKDKPVHSYLAYVYYGNPRLTLSRARSAAAPLVPSAQPPAFDAEPRADSILS